MSRSRSSSRGRTQRLAAASLLLGAIAVFAPGSALPAVPASNADERADRILLRVPVGSQLPESLREGAKHLFAGWWRVPVQSETSSAASRIRIAAPPGSLVTSDRIHRLELGPRTASNTTGSSTSFSATIAPPNDPLYVQQWHLRAVQAEAAWQRATGDGVVVAVIDSGVSPDGPDGYCHPLAGEYSSVTDDEGPGEARDLIGHGTFVAGVVAECTGNAIGSASLAPDARILAIRACTANGECDSSDVATAIVWAATHGADVINLSLGMRCPDSDWPACSTEIENDAIALAVANGVTIVANAGNAGHDRIGFPANHPDVIGVGALNAVLAKTTYSSWGSALSLTAPGGEPGADDDGDGYEDEIVQETLGRICSPADAFAYCHWSGTSFAAPHVAAAVALLIEAQPTATPAQLRQALEESALDRGAPGFDPIYGHGALRTGAALTRLDEILAEAPGCSPSATTLCLGDGRFAASVRWTNYVGVEGLGSALPVTDDSGLFWFFDASNLEMLVKVIDGCGLNGKRWVFAAATTDVAYELTVVDTVTGLPKTYRNALGTASPATTDTAAFDCEIQAIVRDGAYPGASSGK